MGIPGTFSYMVGQLKSAAAAMSVDVIDKKKQQIVNRSAIVVIGFQIGVCSCFVDVNGLLL